MDGTIFNIQKFCVNDGPGIRTTVFLKGCPLSCKWCHNPESQNKEYEIMFYPNKCIGCRKCELVCENKCHCFSENSHIYYREKCGKCLKCTEFFCDALEVAGRVESVENIINDVLKDKVFYENSGGGMTLSGGEPLMQFDFAYELLKKAKEDGVHTAIETCGFASKEKISEIASVVDLFLFDYKITDSDLHKKMTGVDNKVIIENLKTINALNKKIILRCPIIPTVNDNEIHFKAISALAEELENVIKIEIEPYHKMGEGKYEQLGKNKNIFTQPEDDDVKKWIEKIQKNTIKAVTKA